MTGMMAKSTYYLMLNKVNSIVMSSATSSFNVVHESGYDKVPIPLMVQSNLVIRNVLIRNKLVLRNHFL